MDKDLYPAPGLVSEFSGVANPWHVPGYGRRHDDSPNSGTSMRWLITFTDIMGLMLTFFVMMFSMSEPETDTFAAIATSMNSEFNTHYGRPLNAGPEDSIDVARINYGDALDIQYLLALMRSVINGNDVLKSMNFDLQPEGDHLALSIPEETLFESDAATLREGNMRVLFALGGSFSRIKNAIEIVGEGNNAAEGAERWSAGLTRSAVVAGAMQRVGYTQDLTLRGSITTTRGRNDENAPEALSRTLDIDIMNHDGRKREVFAD